MKLGAFAFLFIEAIIGLSTLSSTSALTLLFGLIICKHALIGFYAYFAESTPKWVSFFHSYFSFFAIACFMVGYFIGNFEQLTFGSLILATVFVVDTLVGLYLLAKTYKYELKSYSVTTNIDYNVIRNQIKPTFTK